MNLSVRSLNFHHQATVKIQPDGTRFRFTRWVRHRRIPQSKISCYESSRRACRRLLQQARLAAPLALARGILERHARRPNPPSARGTLGAPHPAISCLGAAPANLSALSDLWVPLLSRCAPFRGLVHLRQRIVSRSQTCFPARSNRISSRDGHPAALAETHVFLPDAPSHGHAGT